MHDDTRDPLRSLDREIAPPALLETRVRHTLAARGLLRPRVAMARRRFVTAAAAVAIFAAGYAVRAIRPDAAPQAGDINRYALLLYEDDTFDNRRPEAELVAEYRAWAVDLGERGRLESGEKLTAEGYLLEGEREPLVQPQPGVMADAGVLTGVFIIRAANEAEALRIARTCPHLKYGGRINLRPIEET